MIPPRQTYCLAGIFLVDSFSWLLSLKGLYSLCETVSNHTQQTTCRDSYQPGRHLKNNIKI